MKRRIKRLTSLALCLLLLCPWQVFAANDTVATVTGDGVVLRERAGNGFAAVNLAGEQVVLQKGDTVELLSGAEQSEEGDASVWYFVIYSFKGSNLTGYVRADQLSIAAPEAGKAVIAFSGSESVLEGQSVSVSFSVTSSTAMGAWLIRVSFDADALEYVSGADNASAGELLFCDSSDGATAVTKNLTFTAKQAGETALSVSSAQVISYESESEMEIDASSLSLTVIPRHDPVWGKASYTWSDDLSTCTATHRCTVCGEEEWDTATVIVSPRAATCQAPAATVYTASFFVEDFEEQIRVVEVNEALAPHTWNAPQYVWTESGQCIASHTCSVCGKAESEYGAVTTRIKTAATETEPGVRSFTAVFTNAAFETQYLEKPVPFAGNVLWGDANGDGAISSKDIVRLKNYLANLDDKTGASTVEIQPGADANGDGTVSSKDIVRLKNYLANLDDETGASTVLLGPAA